MVSHSLPGRSTHSQPWAEPGKDQSLPLISESLGAQFSYGLQAQPCDPGVTHPCRGCPGTLWRPEHSLPATQEPSQQHSLAIGSEVEETVFSAFYFS